MKFGGWKTHNPLSLSFRLPPPPVALGSRANLLEPSPTAFSPHPSHQPLAPGLLPGHLLAPSDLAPTSSQSLPRASGGKMVCGKPSGFVVAGHGAPPGWGWGREGPPGRAARRPRAHGSQRSRDAHFRGRRRPSFSTVAPDMRLPPAVPNTNSPLVWTNKSGLCM